MQPLGIGIAGAGPLFKGGNGTVLDQSGATFGTSAMPQQTSLPGGQLGWLQNLLPMLSQLFGPQFAGGPGVGGPGGGTGLPGTGGRTGGPGTSPYGGPWPPSVLQPPRIPGNGYGWGTGGNPYQMLTQQGIPQRMPGFTTTGGPQPSGATPSVLRGNFTDVGLPTGPQNGYLWSGRYSPGNQEGMSLAPKPWTEEEYRTAEANTRARLSGLVNPSPSASGIPTAGDFQYLNPGYTPPPMVPGAPTAFGLNPGGGLGAGALNDYLWRRGLGSGQFGTGMSNPQWGGGRSVTTQPYGYGRSNWSY